MKGVLKPIVIFATILLTIGVVVSDFAQAKNDTQSRATGQGSTTKDAVVQKSPQKAVDLKEVLDGQAELDKQISDRFKLSSDQN